MNSFFTRHSPDRVSFARLYRDNETYLREDLDDRIQWYRRPFGSSHWERLGEVRSKDLEDMYQAQLTVNGSIDIA